MRRLLVIAVAACSSSHAPSSPDGSMSTGGVTLAVTMASAPVTVLQNPPSAGHSFVELQITLSNTSSSTPLSTSPVLFGLQTDGALLLMVSPLQSDAAMACDGNASVMQGGSLSCGLLYEVPAAQHAKMLSYDDGHGHMTTAMLPAIAGPDVCVVVRSYGHFMSSACISCISGACPEETQALGTDGCNGACQQCVGQDATDGCACDQSCQTATCWTDLEAAYQCAHDQCASSCM